LRNGKEFDSFIMKMEKPAPGKKIGDWSELLDYRPVRLNDLDQIMEIELRSFKTPWSRKMFLRELELNFSYNRAAELRDDKKIAGYVFCWLTKPEASIMSIAVREDLRNQGLGSCLMARTLSDLKAAGAAEAWLEVRPSNSAALALYRRFGFREVGVRPRYYRDSGEDAVVMKKEL